MSIFGLKMILSKKNRLERHFGGAKYKIRYTEFLQPDRLRDEGLGFFDSWASNFGKTVTAVEYILVLYLTNLFGYCDAGE